MMRKTKIVCTLGTVSQSREMLVELGRAGMDVARLNFSHGTHEWHSERFRLLREAEEDLGRPLAVLQDLSGPKLRIGDLPVEGLQINPGDAVIFTGGRFEPGSPPKIPLPIPELLAALQPDHHVFLDDGMMDLRVTDRIGEEVRCEAVHGGCLRSRKGLSAPAVPFDIPALTAKDFRDLDLGLALGVDFVAVSFVRRAADIAPVREAIQKANSPAQIIAKIEQPEAVAAIEEILDASDGLMVARGDLGVEMPLVQVPVIQKDLIRRSVLRGKPVITATQMLESMTNSPRPTRAEVSDVANAIYDGTSAVMLSAESAVGSFPVETVRTMAAIAEFTEGHLDYAGLLRERLVLPAVSITDAISQGVVEIAADLNASAIICATTSGYTARMVSRMRPPTQIIAATSNAQTFRRLSMYWGVKPLHVKASANTDEELATVVKCARDAGLIQPGDKVVITLGAPVGVPGHTNLIKVQVVE